jgi:hypothetical protein
MQYVRLGIARYAAVADALTLGATYSKLEGGRVPMERALLTTGRALLSYPLLRGLRFALRTMGERQPNAPPSPSLLISKHRPSVKKSSIWSRKKSPIWGMRSGPPRYYNLMNRQAGRPLNLPPPRATRLFCGLRRQSWLSRPGLCSKPSCCRPAALFRDRAKARVNENAAPSVYL